MVERELEQVNQIISSMTSLIRKRKRQSASIEELIKQPLTVAEKAHYIRLNQQYTQDMSQLFAIMRSLSSLRMKLEGLELTIQTAAELESCISVLQAARMGIAALENNKRDLDVLTDVTDELGSCLLPEGEEGDQEVVRRHAIESLQEAPTKAINMPSAERCLI